MGKDLFSQTNLRLIAFRIDEQLTTDADGEAVQAHLLKKSAEFRQKNNLPEDYVITPDEMLALIQSDDFKHPDYRFEVSASTIYAIELGDTILVISEDDHMGFYRHHDFASQFGFTPSATPDRGVGRD